MKSKTSNNLLTRYYNYRGMFIYKIRPLGSCNNFGKIVT